MLTFRKLSSPPVVHIPDTYKCELTLCGKSRKDLLVSDPNGGMVNVYVSTSRFTDPLKQRLYCDGMADMANCPECRAEWVRLTSVGATTRASLS